MLKAGKTKVAIISLVILAIIAVSVFAVFVAAATHKSSAEIEPKWSIPEVTEDYTVTICNLINEGGDKIDEVRLYETEGYNITDAKDKTGWYKSAYNPVKKYYQYTATEPQYYIEEDYCTDFKFSATSPSADYQNCLLEWKFETRDINNIWVFAYANTKIDDKKPITTKTYGTPFYSDGTYDWITTSTEVTLTAIDMSAECGIGVDHIMWRNTLLRDISDTDCIAACNPQGEGTWNNESGDEVTFTKTSESCHLIEFYAVDKLGNTETTKRQCVFVDDTPPEVDKLVGENKIPCSELDDLSCDYYITQKTPITLKCKDVGNHPSNDVTIYYRWRLDGGDWKDGSYKGEEYTLYFNDQDSVHDLEFWCEDAVEKESVYDIETFKVDTTPPTINKKFYSGPKYGDCDLNNPDVDCWIQDTEGHDGTHIHTWAIDEGTCAVDEVQCRWGYWLDNVFYGSWYECDNGDCDISFPQETEHKLIVECWDKLGNKAEYTKNFYVDSSGPTVKKEFIGPQKIESIPDTLFAVEWIDGITKIELIATDNPNAPCGVGEDKIYYINSIDETEKACLDPYTYCRPTHNPNPTRDGWTEYTGPFTKDESCHILEYYSVDKLGNIGPVGVNCFFVDKTAPVTTKEYSLVPYVDPQTNYEYIDTKHQIVLSAEDVGPHPSGAKETYYIVSLLDDNSKCEDVDLCTPMHTYNDDWKIYDGQFGIGQESCHMIEYYSVDNVDKKEPVKAQCVFVDKTVPVIEKSYRGPQYPADLGINTEIYPHYIDSETTVVINAYDSGPHPSGLAILEYRVTLVDDGACEEMTVCKSENTQGTEGWIPYTVPFGNIPESCHLIEIYAEDNVGKSSTHKQCVYVDKTAPETVKRYSGPQYPGGLFDSFSTSIEVDDSGKYLEVTVEDDGTWVTWNFDFPVEEFTGDGNLNLGLIIATDGEGNGPSYQIHNNDGADSGYGWGTWLYSPWGPTIGDGWNGWHSSNNNTPVTSLSWVEATGNRNVPHGDGILQVKILKSELGGSFHWAASPTVGSGFFGVYDDSMQIPTAFGWSTPIVDMTVPNYVYAESVMGEYPHWITSDTLVHLEVIDTGPHKSGIKATYWRNEIVANSYCENSQDCIPIHTHENAGWNLYGTPFTKPTESCHMIEYYSIDNVDKKEPVKAQCVFVDNTPPTLLKEVGQPKTVWDGLDANFYDLDLFCQEPNNCWKVTLDTEISMTCTDPDPHPVNHEKICFNVELDGEEFTDEEYSYCDHYGGEMQDNGYCCLDEITDFYFLEPSEHNLKFYCVDALGNTNEEVDDEKFKVEGNDFEIEINKKWNLISVPVVLLNDDPEEVFANVDVEECIQSVWAYDPEDVICNDDWCVWTPGDAPDNLRIIPGFGYWLVANHDCKLTIGGSLLSPGRTPPSRELYPGWNLIGYYGLSDQEGYYGPDGNGDAAYCSLYSLVNTNAFIPTKRWSSLYGYWETDNPQFEGYGMCDELDPGAGYWIHMPADMEQYTYAPSTGCPTAFWNLICGPF